jgi:hypothetical protein
MPQTSQPALRVTPGGLLRVDKATIKSEANLDGKYLLRCSDPHLCAADIALGYKQFLEVERGWRDMKQILDLRPIYHRLEERIRAHVVLCWLALLLIRVIETTTGDTWNTVRRHLDRLHAGTFTGPTGMFRQRTGAALALMWNGCINHDPSGQILTAWIAKEELRALCSTAATGGHRHEIHRRLWAFYRWCADADIPELTTLTETIETWWPAIEVFLTTDLTNARAEGTNRLIKQVKRAACGFRNRENYRRRVRLHCTGRPADCQRGTRRCPLKVEGPLKAAYSACTSRPSGAGQVSSHACSAGSNTRLRVRNRTPSGASTLKPAPRPGTTSTKSCVCFQRANCDPEIHTGVSALPNPSLRSATSSALGPSHKTPSSTSASPTTNSDRG